MFLKYFGPNCPHLLPIRLLLLRDASMSASDGSATRSRAPSPRLLLPYDTLKEGFDLAAAAMASSAVHTSFPHPDGLLRAGGASLGGRQGRAGRGMSPLSRSLLGLPSVAGEAPRPSIRREELRRIRGLEHGDNLGSSTVPDMASPSSRPGQAKRGRGKAEPRRWY
jgi:hypothetical protein